MAGFGPSLGGVGHRDLEHLAEPHIFRCPTRLPASRGNLEPEVAVRRIRTGVWAEMARILHRTRPYCTVRAIGEVYILVRGTSDCLIIPGSWVRAPPAPPARWCSLPRRLTGRSPALPRVAIGSISCYGCVFTTSMTQRGPVALASRRSPVSKGAWSASASAT